MGGLLAIITARGNRNTDLHINLEITLEIIVFLESMRGFIPEPLAPYQDQWPPLRPSSPLLHQHLVHVAEKASYKL